MQSTFIHDNFRLIVLQKRINRCCTNAAQNGAEQTSERTSKHVTSTAIAANNIIHPPFMSNKMNPSNEFLFYIVFAFNLSSQSIFIGVHTFIYMHMHTFLIKICVASSIHSDERVKNREREREQNPKIHRIIFVVVDKFWCINGQKDTRTKKLDYFIN